MARRKIFVPASKIELVQKYVGGSKKSRPTLAHIGGRHVDPAEGSRRSGRDRSGRRHARSASRPRPAPGIRFPGDTPWQREFDASFPYIETPDQLTAIAAIKGDMEQARPMDRLLCGDVGFGKTELAMRAAFKAVDNGYQVAVLVPTTILAEQHLRTFRGTDGGVSDHRSPHCRAFARPKKPAKIAGGPGRWRDRHRDRHAPAGAARRDDSQPGPGRSSTRSSVLAWR